MLRRSLYWILLLTMTAEPGLSLSSPDLFLTQAVPPASAAPIFTGEMTKEAHRRFVRLEDPFVTSFYNRRRSLTATIARRDRIRHLENTAAFRGVIHDMFLSLVMSLKFELDAARGRLAKKRGPKSAIQ